MHPIAALAPTPPRRGCRIARPNRAIRESRQGPWGPSCGGVGGKPGCGAPTRELSQAREARFVNLDKDPMGRRAVGLAASPDAGAPARELSPAREVQFVNLDKDPLDRRAV